MILAFFAAVFLILSLFDLRQVFFLFFTLGLLFGIRGLEMQESDRKQAGTKWLLGGVGLIFLNIILFVVYSIMR
nr:hypothetical protein [Metabacillus iocasae]